MNLLFSILQMRRREGLGYMCENVTLRKQTFMNCAATAVSFSFEQNKAPFPKVCY